MLYEDELNISRAKFFSREAAYNYFSDITDERVDEIKAQVESFFKNTMAEKSSGINKYIKVLEFLTSSMTHKILPTFDEQLVFFILACDPDLQFLKTYLDMKIISLKAIEETPKSKRRKIEIERSAQLHNYTRSIRSQMGFYDSKLLRYESRYFDVIVKLGILVSNIQEDVTTQLLTAARFARSFEKVPDEEFEKIKVISQQYAENVEDPKNIHTLSYNILTKRRKVYLPNLKEQLILIIYTIDPELNMLKIYEEESNFNEIERRITEEFGYYNFELIRLEKLYHRRFCPDKVISIWSDERKLLWTQD